MIRFFVTLLVVSLILVGGVLLAYDQQWILAKPSFLYETSFLLFFGTAVIYRYLLRVNNGQVFVKLYLLTIVIKLLAYGAYTFLMIKKDHTGASTNVIFFMVSYFIFTGIEIGFLYNKSLKGRAN